MRLGHPNQDLHFFLWQPINRAEFPGHAAKPFFLLSVHAPTDYFSTHLKAEPKKIYNFAVLQSIYWSLRLASQHLAVHYGKHSLLIYAIFLEGKEQ